MSRKDDRISALESSLDALQQQYEALYQERDRLRALVGCGEVLELMVRRAAREMREPRLRDGLLEELDALLEEVD